MNYKTGPGNYKSSYLRTFVKTVDQIVNNSIIVVDDTELFFSARIGSVYGITLAVFLETDANADFRTAWTLPSGAIGTISSAGIQSSGGTNTQNIATEDTHSGAGADFLLFYARVVMGSLAGFIRFRWAQQTADASDTKVLAGSYLQVVQQE